MNRTQEQHEPSFLCVDYHCYSHGVDEPGEGYIGCYECGHLYRTARDLRRAYRRQVMRGPMFGMSKWRCRWRALTVRASKIYFCQECIHDF